MGAWRNSTETQQSGHAPRSCTNVSPPQRGGAVPTPLSERWAEMARQLPRRARPSGRPQSSSRQVRLLCRWASHFTRMTLPLSDETGSRWQLDFRTKKIWKRPLAVSYCLGSLGANQNCKLQLRKPWRKNANQNDDLLNGWSKYTESE